MIAEIVYGLGNIILSLINIYIWIIIIAALLSFVKPDPYNPIVQFLYRITQPAYEIVHRYNVPTNLNGIDLAPLVVIVFLQIGVVIISALLKTL